MDIMLLAIGVAPALFDQIAALRVRLKSGEEVSMDELDAVAGRLEKRPARIQSAP